MSGDTGAERRVTGSIRPPFFYGWLLVAVSFVSMAIAVNARTAFSLLFPPILDEFGWDRGVTAGAFSFGFLISAIVTPWVGWLWREFLSPRAREAQILWFVASQGFLRRFHRRMCKTGFARRTLTGNGMRCAGRGRADLYKRRRIPPGRLEPREAVSCCASLL
jgi:hypothetical protein